MEDKIVEIARFAYPADAQTLMALLRSEGIDCYLRNELTTQIYAGADLGGARVEILKSDLPHALEVMKAGGYECPSAETEAKEEEKEIDKLSGWARRVPFLRRLPKGKQILYFFLLIAILLALLIYMVSGFSVK